MIAKAVIMAAVVRLAVPSPGEAPEAAKVRIETIGESFYVALMAQSESPFVRRHGMAVLAANALAAGAAEGDGFAEDIHAGRRRGSGGDVCFMQVHPGNRTRYNENLAGTDLEASTRCARAGVETLVDAERYCWAKKFRKRWQLATITSYASGRCSPFWKGAKKRAARVSQIAGWLK